MLAQQENLQDHTYIMKWLEMEKKYSSETIPRFDLRTNKSIQELIDISKKPFKKAKDLHELDKEQCDLFEYETDCFCKIS